MANNYKKDGLFTVSQVHKYTGIPITTLQDWHNKGFLKASVTNPIGDIDSYFYPNRDQNGEFQTVRKKGNVRFYSVDDIMKLNMIIICQELGIKKMKDVKGFMDKVEEDPDEAYEKLSDIIFEKISYLRKLASFVEMLYIVGTKNFTYNLATRNKNIKDIIDEFPECDIKDKSNSDEDDEDRIVLLNEELVNIYKEISQYIKYGPQIEETGELPKKLIELLERVNIWCHDKYDGEDIIKEMDNLPPLHIQLRALGQGDGGYSKHINKLIGKGTAEFLILVMNVYIQTYVLGKSLAEIVEERANIETNKLDYRDLGSSDTEGFQNIITVLWKIIGDTMEEYMKKSGMKIEDVNDVFWVHFEQELHKNIEKGIDMAANDYEGELTAEELEETKDMLNRGIEKWKKENGDIGRFILKKEE